MHRRVNSLGLQFHRTTRNGISQKLFVCRSIDSLALSHSVGTWLCFYSIIVRKVSRWWNEFLLTVESSRWNLKKYSMFKAFIYKSCSALSSFNEMHFCLSISKKLKEILLAVSSGKTQLIKCSSSRKMFILNKMWPKHSFCKSTLSSTKVRMFHSHRESFILVYSEVASVKELRACHGDASRVRWPPVSCIAAHSNVTWHSDLSTPQ